MTIKKHWRLARRALVFVTGCCDDSGTPKGAHPMPRHSVKPSKPLGLMHALMANSVTFLLALPFTTTFSISTWEHQPGKVSPLRQRAGALSPRPRCTFGAPMACCRYRLLTLKGRFATCTPYSRCRRPVTRGG